MFKVLSWLFLKNILPEILDWAWFFKSPASTRSLVQPSKKHGKTNIKKQIVQAMEPNTRTATDMDRTLHTDL